MGKGLDSLNRVMGIDASFTFAAEQVTETVTIVFNEFVGFIDDKRRSLYTAKLSDFSTRDPARSDYFVLPNETSRWHVMDVRIDKSGGIELRCDQHLERT